MNGIQLNKQALALFLVFAAVGGAYYFFHYTKQVDPLSENLELKKKESGSSASWKMETGKIDDKGQYLPFFGYTIVSQVQNPPAIVEKFIKETKTLSKYLSALPASSYHVTIYDIFSQKAIPEKYTPASGAVPSSHWSQAMQTLHSDLFKVQKECDLVQKQIIFSKRNFSDFPRRAKRAFLVEGNITANMEELSSLRQECKKTFGKDDSGRIFHMTVGYTYKDIDDSVMPKIKEELDELWKLLDDSYNLEKPNVCYFESMKEFVPTQSMQLGQ